MQEKNEDNPSTLVGAQDTAYPPHKPQRAPLGVGTLIGDSFSLLFGNPFKVSILGTLPLVFGLVPLVFLVNVQSDLFLDPVFEMAWSSFALQVLVSFATVVAMFAIAAALISRLVCDVKMGTPIRWSGYLKLLVSAAPMIAILGTAVGVLWLAVSSAIFSLGFLSSFLSVLIVPAAAALYFWVVSSFAVMPAVVVTEKSGFSSLKRCLVLTRGYRWPVLGTLFLGGLCGAIINILLNLVAFVLTLPVAFVSVTASTFLSGALSVLTYGIYVGFIVIVITLVYIRLREIKEGTGIEGLEAIFD